MYQMTNRGLGRTLAEDGFCKTSAFGGIFIPTCWTALQLSTIAPPPAPTGDALTLPPASGADAAALVQALADQQLRDQQALNAKQVQSSGLDQAASGLVDTATSISDFGSSLLAPGGISWLVWGALGLGIFGLVVFSGGSPRRYGR